MNTFILLAALWSHCIEPAPAMLPLNRLNDSRFYAAQNAARKRAQKDREAQLKAAVNEHSSWKKHMRKMHRTLRLFYGRPGSECLFLLDDEGKTQTYTAEDFFEGALTIELPYTEEDCDDFCAGDATRQPQVREEYPYTLTVTCNRVLQIAPEKMLFLGTVSKGDFGAASYPVAVSLLNPTPAQMEMRRGDSLEEYFTRELNDDGTPAFYRPASSATASTGGIPAIKSYNTLKDDTRAPNAKRPPKKR